MEERRGCASGNDNACMSGRGSGQTEMSHVTTAAGCKAKGNAEMWLRMGMVMVKLERRGGGGGGGGRRYTNFYTLSSFCVLLVLCASASDRPFFGAWCSVRSFRPSRAFATECEIEASLQKQDKFHRELKRP